VANASGMTSNADSNAKMFGEDTNRQRGALAAWLVAMGDNPFFT